MKKLIRRMIIILVILLIILGIVVIHEFNEKEHDKGTTKLEAEEVYENEGIQFDDLLDGTSSEEVKRENGKSESKKEDTEVQEDLESEANEIKQSDEKSEDTSVSESGKDTEEEIEWGDLNE